MPIEPLTLIQSIGLLEFIRYSYPVSVIAVILGGFGAAIRGIAGRARLKFQANLIESLGHEIERLT